LPLEFVAFVKNTSWLQIDLYLKLWDEENVVISLKKIKDCKNKHEIVIYVRFMLLHARVSVVFV
jgi:hypothetical protein